MLIVKKFKILRKTLALLCVWGFLGLNNVLAFSLLDYPNPDNFLSPQLNISIPLFIDDYQKITKAPRWLRPDIVGFLGGTGGNIAGNILSFSDVNKFLTEKLFVSFIISPHDDGGSSVILQRMLSEYLGYTLSPGDTNNIFAGLTSYFKKRILRTRFSKDIKGNLLHDELEKNFALTEDLAKPRLLFKDNHEKETVDKINIEGIDYPLSYDPDKKVFSFGPSKEAVIGEKIIFKSEQFVITKSDGRTVLCFVPDDENKQPLLYDLKNDSNWQVFKAETLSLAEGFDSNFINPDLKILPGEIVDISGGSMGNFLIAAKMIQTGAYDSKRKEFIDQDKYHQGIQELCELLDIDNGFVSFSTFDPATLYAKLKTIAIEKDNNVLLLDEANNNVLRENGIVINKIDRAEGIFNLHYSDSKNNNTSFGLNIREYIEGVVSLNNPGKLDSYSEIEIPLTVFEQYPVEIGYNGLRIKIKILEGKIVELEYIKDDENVKIGKDQIAGIGLEGQILLALPEEIDSLPEEKLRSLPRIYINPKKQQANIVLDSKGIGIDLSINEVDLKIKGRLVIGQTNITDSLHRSGIVDFGFLNDATPRVNQKALLAIANAPLFMMGPGSQFTSLMSLLLIPEVVEALRQRVADGKESLFIFNAVRDTESVDSENIRKIIYDIERITGCRFGEIFNNAVVNDLESLERDFNVAEDFFRSVGVSSPDYAQAKELFEEYSQTFSLMNELEGKIVPKTRKESDFSKLAKYSMGKIGFSKNDLSELINQGVEVYKTKVILSSREVREEGNAGKEVSIRYDNAEIAHIIDQILWKRGALFKQDEKLLKLRQKIIAEYFDGDEEEFDKAIERIRKEGILKSSSPAEAVRYIFERLQKDDFAFSEQKIKKIADKKVIITNLKHTLCSKNGITPRIKENLELFLKRGGKLIVISGFEFSEIQKRLLNFIDKSLWSSIIPVSNYGTEAWYWEEQQGKFASLYTSFYEEAEISPVQRARWRQIIENTIKEYELDKPLKFIGGLADSTIAKLKDRGTMFALTLGSRRYLHSLNMITLQNYRLEDQYLPLIADDGILRTPIIERLNRMFAKYNLPVTAVLGGTGTINTMVKKAAEKGQVIQRVLWAAKEKGLLPKQNLEEKILIIGKGNYDIAKKFESDEVPWIVFQAPRRLTKYTIEFKKKYGVQATEIFLGELNSIQSSLEAVESLTKINDFSLSNLELISQSI